MPSFVEIDPPLPEIFKGFYHIWAWWPSWSCDPDVGNKLSFPPTHGCSFDWQAISEKMYEHCEHGPCVYKLTYEPSAQVS